MALENAVENSFGRKALENKKKKPRGRYADLETAYERLHLIPTRFHRNIQLLSLGEKTLPAIVVKGPINEALPTHIENRVVNDIGTIIGIPDWRANLDEKLGTDGKLSGESTEAGWGHTYEKHCITDLLTKLEVPVISFTAEQVVGDVGRLYRMKLKAHSAVQHGQNVLREIENDKLIQSLFKDNIRAWAAYLGFALQGVADPNQKTRPEDKLIEYDVIYSGLLKLSYYLNYRLFDKRVVEALDIFREHMGVIGGHSANVANVRMNKQNEKGLHTKIIPMVVDVGYTRLADGGITPGNLLEFVTKYGPITVPDKITAQILSKFYGVHDSFIVGDNVGQVEDEGKFLEKWKNTKKERIILTSTSGHGANAEELSQILDDYTAYKKSHRNSPYTVILFTGHLREHSANLPLNKTFEKAKQNQAIEITVTWGTDFNAFKNQVLKNKGKLTHVRTVDVNLTGIVKLWLEQISHLEAIKSGEAHTINPHVATVTSLLTPAPPNEPLNGIFALLNGGSIARSPEWARFVAGYDRRMGFNDEKIEKDMREIPGLEPQPENYFESLDFFWGDTKEGRQLAKNIVFEQAMKGYVKTKSSTIPVAALEIAQALGLDLMGDRGRVIRQNIEAFHEKEMVRKRSAVARMYPHYSDKDDGAKAITNTGRLAFEIIVTAMFAAIGYYLGAQRSKTTKAN